MTAPAAVYRTRGGDMFDDICWRWYGESSDSVPLMLEANPGLADEIEPLRAGLLITLPEISPPPSTAARIWD